MVQNVNLRYNICIFADKHRITGYVKNLPDKTVEIHFIGKETSFDKLINFIKDSPGGSKVEEINSKSINAEKKFENFQILY